MKTAVSIPDPLFRAAEAVSRRLRLPRSVLYARALESFLREHDRAGITEKLDEVYGAVENHGLHPALRRLQAASLEPDDWS